MVEKLIREVKTTAKNGVEYVDKEEYVDVDGYTWYSAYTGWWNAPYRKG